jgi:hypothetical protein
MAILAGAVAGCEADPAAFRPLLREVLRGQASMRPLIAILRQQPETEQHRYADRLITTLSGPFRRAQAAGLLRPDLEPADLTVVLTMVEAAVAAAADQPAGAARVRLAIDVVLDGLFVPTGDRPPAPLACVTVQRPAT